jgi:hypothetical protein
MTLKHKTLGSGSLVWRQDCQATLDHSVGSKQLYGPHVNIAASELA